MSHAIHDTADTPLPDDQHGGDSDAGDEVSLQARHGRALDELIRDVMPDSWAGYDRLAEDAYPYSGEASPQQERDPAA